MTQASLNRDKSNSLATFPMSVLKNPANELCGLVHLSTHGHSIQVGLFTRCPLLVWATELRVNSFLVHKLCLEHKNKPSLREKDENNLLFCILNTRGGMASHCWVLVKDIYPLSLLVYWRNICWALLSAGIELKAGKSPTSLTPTVLSKDRH